MRTAGWPLVRMVDTNTAAAYDRPMQTISLNLLVTNVDGSRVTASQQEEPVESVASARLILNLPPDAVFPELGDRIVATVTILDSNSAPKMSGLENVDRQSLA